MTIAALMVVPDLGSPNTALLKIAGDLALRFHASVLGVAAGQLVADTYTDGYGAGTLVQVTRDAVDAQIKSAETEFRTALETRLEYVGWRSSVSFEQPALYLACEARGTDMVLMNAPSTKGEGLMTSALLMQVGRPVLSIPSHVRELKLGHVLVAWRDTREARRAVLDGLPVLAAAARVSVFEIAARDDMRCARMRVDDVTHWLGRHGVTAEPMVSCTDGEETAALDDIAREQKADLVVAGAFGHSRLREWMLGGFTRHLLHGTERCALVSH